MSWSKGYAEWVEGDTAYLSIAFTWLLDKAYAQALWHRAIGRKVRVGGPALFLIKMQHELAGLDGVVVGGDYPEAVTKHNPEATFFSRGCDVGCSFCIVPAMEGRTFTLIADAVPRPILCDNNISGLPADFQEHIIRRYQDAGVQLRDANSGFEPRSFLPDVYARWKPLVNAGDGPWRFAYDDMQERAEVLAVMRMLADEPARRKRVYVLIGNEPFEDCLQRIREVIAGGCEPHVQPVMKLNALDRRPWVKDSLDWGLEAERRGIVPSAKARREGVTPGEQLLADVARWANGYVWRRADFNDYVRTRKNIVEDMDHYDANQGLFTFQEPEHTA